ncbi:hypothetical protein H1R20_g14378, partial [Candolleomyces eurysporus]
MEFDPETDMSQGPAKRVKGSWSDAYIAVHGGAGVYGQATEKGVKRVLREACSRALSAISEADDMLIDEDPSPALTMVGTATTVLEDDPLLNAGYGSNLTLDGTVECDAAIMSGKDQKFGSVGAVSDVKNPITLARAILEYSSQQDKLGRVPPLTLVSNGASSFARRLPNYLLNGADRLKPQLAQPASLISPTAKAQWEKWKSRLEDPKYHPPPLSINVANPAPQGPLSPSIYSPSSSYFPYRSPPASPSPETPLSSFSFSYPISTPVDSESPEGVRSSSSLRDVQDTVGAVAWHPKDGTAASVSSGGILLKLPGRVGEAAVYGAGCWAQHQDASADIARSASVACSASGTGEYIIRSSLARVVGERVLEGMTVPPRVVMNESTETISAASNDEDDDTEDGDEGQDNDTHQILQTILENQFWGVC